MQKAMIALFGVHDSGKTTTIRLAYETLKKKGRCIDPGLSSGSEVRAAILEIKGIKIGFFSVGDWEEILKKYIGSLIEKGCIVIVCATRSRGGTVRFVESHEPDFKLVWIGKEPRQSDRAGGDRLKADEIIAAVETAIENVQLVEA